MSDQNVTPEKFVRMVARACYEANKGVCEGLEDFSQPSWAMASDDAREATIQIVGRHIKALLSGMSLTPEEVHDAWMDHRLANGWRFGPVKDFEAKTHPCLVPYEDLSDGERSKDLVLTAVCKAMIEAYVKK